MGGRSGPDQIEQRDSVEGTYAECEPATMLTVCESFDLIYRFVTGALTCSLCSKSAKEKEICFLCLKRGNSTASACQGSRFLISNCILEHRFMCKCWVEGYG